MQPRTMSAKTAKPHEKVTLLEGVTVRFCGDSGDGMQLAGSQLTTASALAGNDVATFPDYPSEIRAPQGTLAGVSGYQIQFASTDIFTPGDQVDALIAMNPAALQTNLGDLRGGGILIVNRDAFTEKWLRLAGYETSPLEDDSLKGYQLHVVDMTSLTRGAVEKLGIGRRDADRCRNFFAIGLVFWMYGRSLEPTNRFIDEKFGSKPVIAEANHLALKAGYDYGVTTEALASTYRVDPAKLPAGEYRNMTGNQAMAWGLVAAAKRSNKTLFLGSYPITPASDILHELSRFKKFGVRTFQAEDELAAMTSIIGAAFGGAMAVTTSSGPGIALKGEAMGLAVILELPMVIINVQRGGPSTGLPTKTEQSDLFQALFGRHGECPMPVLAAHSPADGFDVVQEAWRIAVQFMTPVMVLSDGYIANGAEPWRIPKMSELPQTEVTHPKPDPTWGKENPYQAYQRDARLARPWAIPGTEHLMHRLGGLETENITGAVSYDPKNHQEMVELRLQKVMNVSKELPPLQIDGEPSGRLLVLSWGSPYGACITAVHEMQQKGESVSHVDLRHVYPFPSDLGDILSRFDKVLIPELNLGQLRMLIRSEYLIEPEGLNKVQGKPFAVFEIVHKMEEILKQP